MKVDPSGGAGPFDVSIWPLLHAPVSGARPAFALLETIADGRTGAGWTEWDQPEDRQGR